MKEVKGIIDHRILLNYRIDPKIMQKNLPDEFKPKIINGYAVGGICQVSLSEMRPKGLPNILGAKSHNVAHRIAAITSKGEGVFVTRRDTNSVINTISSGRLFPGVYKKADFQVESNDQSYSVRIEQEGNCLMNIKAKVSEDIEPTSIFNSVNEISDFFLTGNIGWSQKENDKGFDSIELSTVEWSMKPLRVSEQFSAYFMDESKFPKGSVEFDSAMVMQGLEHSWISREELCQICI
jgi:uncharacterized protein YqjF (DUF2071 family)